MMIEPLKRSLRTHPKLYGMIQKAYYKALYICERSFLGTRLHEWIWKVRKFENEDDCSYNHPHRRFVADQLKSLQPVVSLLEVGCNAGQNLALLADLFPGAELHGVDVNAGAIETAKRVLSKKPSLSFDVRAGKADNLSHLPDQSVDVGFTDATLMYVGPDKIKRTLNELARVSRKGLILNEWHLFDHDAQSDASFWYDAHWVHNYRALLADLKNVRSIDIQRLPEGLWGPGGWSKYGALVKVEFDGLLR